MQKPFQCLFVCWYIFSQPRSQGFSFWNWEREKPWDRGWSFLFHFASFWFEIQPLQHGKLKKVRKIRCLPTDNFKTKIFIGYVPVNSKTAHPPPRAIPGHLTRVKLRTVGNLTQNEVRPLGHLTFMSKRLSAVGSKRISQFFDSAREPLFKGHCSCRFHVGFSVVVVLYSYIVEYAFV